MIQFCFIVFLQLLNGTKKIGWNYIMESSLFFVSGIVDQVSVVFQVSQDTWIHKAYSVSFSIVWCLSALWHICMVLYGVCLVIYSDYTYFLTLGFFPSFCDISIVLEQW